MHSLQTHEQHSRSNRQLAHAWNLSPLTPQQVAPLQQVKEAWA